MSKVLTKYKTNSKSLTSKSKFLSWDKFIKKSSIKLDKNSQAGVISDEKGAPQLFLFDTFALLDILSEIDDRLADKLDHKDYHSQKFNPSHSLIAQIESRLPVNSDFIVSLKNSIKEAQEKGWVTLAQVQKELS